MAAPRTHTPSEQQYSDCKLRTQRWARTLVSMSKRLPNGASVRLWKTAKPVQLTPAHGS